MGILKMKIELELQDDASGEEQDRLWQLDRISIFLNEICKIKYPRWRKEAERKKKIFCSVQGFVWFVDDKNDEINHVSMVPQLFSDREHINWIVRFIKNNEVIDQFVTEKYSYALFQFEAWKTMVQKNITGRSGRCFE